MLCPSSTLYNFWNLSLLFFLLIVLLFAPFYSKSDTSSTKLQQVHTSIYTVNIFNDERDHILKSWNWLQACWGIGKGYYNVMMPPIEYTPETPFYMFRNIGYNRLPHHENSDGIVLLLFDKPYNDLKNQEEAMRNGIMGILGNRPYLTVDVIEIKSFNDTQTKVKIVVSEKTVPGFPKKIPALEMSTFLNQPLQKQQLSNAGTVLIVPVVTSSRIEVDEYLRKVPTGMDVETWIKAIFDNPNPNSFIPILINGFADLHTRMLHQRKRIASQLAFITKVKEDIRTLREKATQTRSYMEFKRPEFRILSHRILKLLVNQERNRHYGCVMSPLKETIQRRLQNLIVFLVHPKFAGETEKFLFYIRAEEFRKIQEKNARSFQIIPQQLSDEIVKFIDIEHNALQEMVKILRWDIRTMNAMVVDMDAHGLIPKNNFEKAEKYFPLK